MYKLTILFCSILLYSCKEKIKNETATQDMPESRSVKIFSAIEKDSAFYVTYKFEKQTNGNGSVIYKYTGDDLSSFSVLADTVFKKFDLIRSAGDTSAFYVEDEKVFTVNGVNYRVFKLMAGKGVTDGEVCYFFNTYFGLLIKRSNTWRIGHVLNPEKNDTAWLQLTALLHNVYTAEGFYQNNVPPESKIKKYITPKVE